jgi:hypothetical protein
LDSCWQVRRTSWRAEAEAAFFARPGVVYAVSKAFALNLSTVPGALLRYLLLIRLDPQSALDQTASVSSAKAADS